jgi:uncharacterized membrane protein
METNRVEAFSDGVFAIAITLLILTVDIGDIRGSLGDAVLRIWPSYLAYAVSFLTIGIMWVNHHTIMRHIERADRTFLFLNLGLLMCVAFVPFPTRLVAEFIRSSGDRATAALTYGITMTITAVFFNALWNYAAWRRRLLRTDADRREVSGITRSYMPGAPIYGTATLIALASPIASVALFAAIALFFALSSTLFGRDETA